jgi:hypothetical protein
VVELVSKSRSNGRRRQYDDRSENGLVSSALPCIVVFRFAEVLRYGNLQKLWCFDGANALKISR